MKYVPTYNTDLNQDDKTVDSDMGYLRMLTTLKEKRGDKPSLPCGRF